jgi:hypothetical protein
MTLLTLLLHSVRFCINLSDLLFPLLASDRWFSPAGDSRTYKRTPCLIRYR